MASLKELKKSARTLCSPVPTACEGIGLVQQPNEESCSHNRSSSNVPSTSARRKQHLTEAISATDGPEYDEEGHDEGRRFDDNEEEIASNVPPEPALNLVFRTLSSDPSDGRIEKWLTRAATGKYKKFIMKTPPLRPKGGEVILYQCKDAKDVDYRRDGYTGFQATFNNYKYNGPLMRLTFLLKEKKKTIHGFQKQAIFLREHADKPEKIILIWYYGDEKVWTPRPHGNANDSSRPFTSNTKAVKTTIRNIAHATGKSPMLVYRRALQTAAAEDENFQDRQVIVGPRDKKETENIMHSMRLAKRVHEDELMAVYLMGRTKMFGDFIREMKLLDKEIIVLAETEMLNLAKALIREASNPDKKIPLCIGFDTTFNLTDSYVSPMVMRNCFLEGNPIFPVAFLIHERRTADVHRMFWDTMKTVLPLNHLPLTIPIVTDREAGLLKGMFQSLGELGVDFHHIPCTVHIKRDVKQWLKDNNASSENIQALVGEVETLLNATTEEYFNQKYMEMSETWSPPFAEYISTRIKSDMMRAAHFSASRFEAFRETEATSNFIESLNMILKCSAEWKELRLDSIVMNLFNVTMGYLTEFDRAYRNTGKHRPKPAFVRRGPMFQLPPYAYWPEEKFIEKFKADYRPENSDSQVSEAAVTSTRALARLACDLGYVVLNSQNLTFTVTHPYDLSKAVVEEDDGNRLVCSCQQPGMCIHKEAYLHVTKKVLENGKTAYKLSALRKRTRIPKGRSGRKKIRMVDVHEVIPAPDSVVATRNEEVEVDLINEPASSHATQAPKTVRAGSRSTQVAHVIGDSNHSENGELQEDKEEKSSSDAENNIKESDDGQNGDESNATDGSVSDSDEGHDSPHPKLNVNMVDESEEEDEDMGLHFYSHRSYVESLQSNGSTKGTSSISEYTPESFQIPTADIHVPAHLYKGLTKCLSGQKMLGVDVVDNACALWIKIHELEEKIAFASTNDVNNAMNGTIDSYRKVVSWAYRAEALNARMILAPVCLPPNHVFALGIILWRPKQIILINSNAGIDIDVTSVFMGLLRLVYGSYTVAACPIDGSGWTFATEDSMQADNDRTSSGVLTILNAFTICSKKPFRRNSDFPCIKVLRKWIAKSIAEADCDETIKLRKGQPVHRLSPQERSNYAMYLRTIEMPEPEPFCKSTYEDIRGEIDGLRYINNKCSASECKGVDLDDENEGIVCALCRGWFHYGVCIPVSTKNMIFFYCKICEPLHTRFANLLSAL